MILTRNGRSSSRRSLLLLSMHGFSLGVFFTSEMPSSALVLRCAAKARKDWKEQEKREAKEQVEAASQQWAEYERLRVERERIYDQLEREECGEVLRSSSSDESEISPAYWITYKSGVRVIEDPVYY